MTIASVEFAGLVRLGRLSLQKTMLRLQRNATGTPRGPRPKIARQTDPFADACAAIIIANSVCGSLVSQHHEYRINGISKVGFGLETKYLRPKGDPTVFPQGFLRIYLFEDADANVLSNDLCPTLPIPVGHLNSDVLFWFTHNFTCTKQEPRYEPALSDENKTERDLWEDLVGMITVRHIVQICKAVLTHEAAEAVIDKLTFFGFMPREPRPYGSDDMGPY